MILAGALSNIDGKIIVTVDSTLSVKSFTVNHATVLDIDQLFVAVIELALI